MNINNRVSQWNMNCNNKPYQTGSEAWKKSLINQLKRLDEEMKETIKALEDKDIVEVLDGLVDLKVVLDGAFFLSNLPIEEAFEEVMDNNDLKYTTDYGEAYDALEHHGIEHFNIQEAVSKDGTIFYSVHRNSDNKICKLLDHPRVDLTRFVTEV